MKLTSPFVITISRQLGSGGAYVGQALAKKLNIYYADRDIICQAARKFSLLEEDVESREEKISSFWDSYLQFYSFGFPDIYLPPQIIVTTDDQLFNTESEIIKRIAKERSAVIIGRCGSHILRDHPNHVSLFLYGDIPFRKGRIQKLYNISEEEAGKKIAQSDAERARFYHSHTDKEWTDATQYDLCMDSSKIDLDECVELILKYLKQ